MAHVGAEIPIPADNDARASTARMHVSLIAQELMMEMNRPKIPILLDETNGCKDWKRVKEWLVREAGAAGVWRRLSKGPALHG